MSKIEILVNKKDSYQFEVNITPKEIFQVAKVDKKLNAKYCYFNNNILSIDDELKESGDLIFISEDDLQDHRIIGQQQNLFFFSPLVGKGIPLWLPKGVFLKNQIRKFIAQEEEKYDFLPIETPVLGDLKLYETSGHYNLYRDSIFPLIEMDDNKYILRPMSCPHHCIVFDHQDYTQEDLPVRFTEEVMQFRNEASGALLGLERTRIMNLTDCHIFLKEEDLQSEIAQNYQIIANVLEKLGINISYIELALPSKDKSKYMGDEKIWDKSIEILKEFLISQKIEFIEKEGEAAFYGPKLDFQYKNKRGHHITISTIQLDFFLPTKFNLTYRVENNERKTPILIHRGLIGTFERFISILLEHYNGVLPSWLSYDQVVIIPVNNELHKEYALNLNKQLRNSKVRSFVDLSNQTMGYKIRKHTLNKIPYYIFIGDKEIENDGFVYQIRNSKEKQLIKNDKINDFINIVNSDNLIND